MMPNDTYVIRYRPGDADSAAARAMLEILISAETAALDRSSTQGDRPLPALTRSVNKLLQNVLSVLAKGARVSIVVLDDTSLLDVRDTAEILGYHHAYVTRLLKKGELSVHPYRAGRKRLVPAEAVVARILEDPAGHAGRVRRKRR